MLVGSPQGTGMHVNTAQNDQIRSLQGPSYQSET